MDLTKQLIELSLYLNDTIQQAKDTLGFEFEENDANEKLTEIIKDFRIVRDGTKFTSFINQFKLPAILKSKDADKLSHLAHSFSTGTIKFKNSFKKVIRADEFDVLLKVNEHTSACTMRIETEKGD